MLITNFTVSSFNFFWNDAIPTLHGSKRLNESLFILWKKQKIDLIKAHIENDVSIDTYVDQIFATDNNDCLLIKDYYQANYASRELYIYPYSATKFCKHIFHNFLPSAADRMFLHMQQTNHLVLEKYDPTPLNFKACILSKAVVDEHITIEYINHLNSICFKPNSSLTEIKSLFKSFEDLTLDNEAYLLYINELETAILDLNKQLDLEKKEGLNGYLLNWH